MAYTYDDILADAKLRAFTVGTVLSDSDILRLMNDELLGILTAKEMAAVQGLLAVESPAIPIVPGTAIYDLPYRAVGGKLRYACLMDAVGNRTNLRMGRPERYVTKYNLTQLGQTPWAGWFEGGRIRLFQVPSSTAASSLVLGIYLRPGRPILAASASSATAGAAVGATTISCAAVPAGMNGVTSIDIIRALPPFNVIAYDLPVTALTTGATSITVTAPGVPTYAVNAGDWITKTEESVAPQMPAEVQPLLSARTAKRILQARGDSKALQMVIADIEDLEKDIYTFMSNRDEGQIDAFETNALMNSGFSRFGFGLGGF